MSRDWRDQEKKTASELGGSRNAGSGAFHRKGDVRAPGVLIECKFTGKKSMTLQASVLEKIVAEALTGNRLPILQIELNGRRYGLLEWDDVLGLLDG